MEQPGRLPSVDPTAAPAPSAAPGSAAPVAAAAARVGGHSKSLYVGITAVIAVFIGVSVYLYVIYGTRPAARPVPTPPPAEAVVKPLPPPPDANPPAAEEAQRQGYSWDVAERAYAAGQFGDALNNYRGLLKEAEKSTGNRRIGDFLRLRVGRCANETGRPKDARAAYSEATLSESPLVRAVACHELARMDDAEGQAMMARMRAYQALAVLGDAGSRPALEADCEFLAARATTCRAIACFGGSLQPPRLAPVASDVLDHLGEEALRTLIDTGANHMATAVLGPRILKKESTRGTRLWSAISGGAPIDDFLARVATETGLEIRWENVEAAARRRPIVMDTAGLTSQRLVEMACGMVGLVARFTGTEAFINDPQSSITTEAQRDLLVRESISMWRRFFLRSADDGRFAYGHFALAAIHECAGDAGDAMSEYQLTYRKYQSDKLAPTAQLRAASIRIELRDYDGARDDLLDLLNHFPDCPASDQVYLRLGQAAMEAGRTDEAAATFKKLYYLDLSLASKAGAALGAGRCCFRKNQFDEAARWLGRRTDLPRDAAVDTDLPEAYALLAKAEAAAGRLPQAVRAYKDALAVAPQGPTRVETLIELAHILVKQEELVAAMGILENLSPKDATPAQADEILIARAEILRSMKLSERASALLRRGVGTASSTKTSAHMTILLAECDTEFGDLEGPQKLLADLMPKLEGGPLAQRAALDLAEIYTKAGQPNQAILVCRELLKSPCTEDVRKSAQAILGRAFERQKDYESAAVAVSGVKLDGSGKPDGGSKPTVPAKADGAVKPDNTSKADAVKPDVTGGAKP